MKLGLVSIAKEKKMICYKLRLENHFYLDFDCTTASRGGPSNVQAQLNGIPRVWPERPIHSGKAETEVW